VSRLEEEVSKLEARQAEIVAALEAPESYTTAGTAQHLNRELTSVVDQLSTATQAWEAAAQKLEQAQP
jgi:ATP-binding cassette, subfamily F, member 3